MSSISIVSNLEMRPWFHGNTTRVEAELTLSSEVNGSFLVRNSESKPGKYVTSIRHEGSTRHYIINMDPLTSQYNFGTPELSFQSLPELIAHHSKISDGLITTLRYHGKSIVQTLKLDRQYIRKEDFLKSTKQLSKTFLFSLR